MKIKVHSKRANQQSKSYFLQKKEKRKTSFQHIEDRIKDVKRSKLGAISILYDDSFQP